MNARTFDFCPPPCGRRITDTDPNGCETPTGQRYCLIHLPREAYPELFDELHRFDQPGEKGKPTPRYILTRAGFTEWEWRHLAPVAGLMGECTVCGNPAAGGAMVPTEGSSEPARFVCGVCAFSPIAGERGEFLPTTLCTPVGPLEVRDDIASGEVWP